MNDKPRKEFLYEQLRELETAFKTLDAEGRSYDGFADMLSQDLAAMIVLAGQAERSNHDVFYGPGGTSLTGGEWAQYQLLSAEFRKAKSELDAPVLSLVHPDDKPTTPTNVVDFPG